MRARVEEMTEEEEARGREVREQNEELRKNLAELREDIENQVWEKDEVDETNQEMPELDAFKDLMNICKAVQSLQQNLESLTM